MTSFRSTAADGLCRVYEDGNGMWINPYYDDTPTTRPGYTDSDGTNEAPPFRKVTGQIEPLTLSNTPIYSSLLFRTLLQMPRN